MPRQRSCWFLCASIRSFGRMTFSGAAPASVLAPLDDIQRITVLDVVRGFAILGLALVKAADFSPDFWANWPSAADRATAWLEENLLADKFFTLFALLFGIGFAIQMDRAVARGASFKRLYVRRSLVLLGIGLAHGLLIWSGDILAGYALVSFVLLAFHNSSNRSLLIAAGIAWLGGHVIWFLRREVLHLMPPPTPDPKAIAALLSSGPPLEILRHEAHATLTYLQRGVVGPGAWMPGVLCLFLLGLYVARSGLLSRVARDSDFCRRALLVTVFVAAIAWPLYELLSKLWPSSELRIPRRLTLAALGQLTTFGLAATYALLLALLTLRRSSNPTMSGLAAVGRMALSNYLLQSVVFVLLYFNYGLGLYGHIRPLPAMLLSAAVYACQMLISVWWLGRYKFGPAEWVWRSLTYERRQPMRRPEPATRLLTSA